MQNLFNVVNTYAKKLQDKSELQDVSEYIEEPCGLISYFTIL
jgi:hypothetical protein